MIKFEKYEGQEIKDGVIYSNNPESAKKWLSKTSKRIFNESFKEALKQMEDYYIVKHDPHIDISEIINKGVRT